MSQDPTTLQIPTFRIGPKNRRIKDDLNPDQPDGYHVMVEAGLSLLELLERYSVAIAPDETQITPENFPQAQEASVIRHFELFDFSNRAEYGRRGVDEAFVRDKLAHFKFRPATLPELICFAGHLRETFRDRWFEAKNILALGSVAVTTETVKKSGWFRKEVITHHYRHYPELGCVAGRPQDILSLSRTERDSDGNWPSETLFLAATLGGA